MSLRHILAPLCLVSAVGLATSAQAHGADGAAMDAQGRAVGNVVPVPAMPAVPAMPSMAAPAVPAGPAWDNAGFERAKADWLYECRRRYPSGKQGTALGAVLGGVIGGVVGNRAAGSGDRTVGTVAGAVLGGVAGGAIGNSADRSRSSDYCESYLEDYLARQQYGYGQYYGQQGMTYGYVAQPVTMMVPVMMVQQQAAVQKPRECKETIVTEEWVQVPTKRRVIYRHLPDKRIPIVPDKRVRTN